MLLEQIKKDSLANRKACMNKNQEADVLKRLEVEKALYSSITGDFKRIEVDQRREVNDEDALTIVRAYVKNCRDNLANYKSVNNTDKIKEVEIEMETLAKYMPKQMTGAELETLIKSIVEANALPKTPASMKPVMAELNGKYKDQFNPKEASDITKGLLKP